MGIPERELVQVWTEQSMASSTLSPQLLFSPHPHVLNVLCVDHGIIRVNEVSLMYNYTMCVPVNAVVHSFDNINNEMHINNLYKHYFWSLSRRLW